MIRRLRLLHRDGASPPVLQQLLGGEEGAEWEDVPVLFSPHAAASSPPAAASVRSLDWTIEPYAPGARLRHHKGGIYTFVGEAADSESGGRQMFLYRSGVGQLWARPASMFDELIDGHIRRFTDHDWAGGNDYMACRRCGSEYDYRRMFMPDTRCPSPEVVP